MQTSVPGQSPLMTSVSPTSRKSSPPSPHEPDTSEVTIDETTGEESMFVNYVDPASVRERKRLLAAVMKGPMEGAGASLKGLKGKI